jgi:hypothetical protein
MLAIVALVAVALMLGLATARAAARTEGLAPAVVASVDATRIQGCLTLPDLVFSLECGPRGLVVAP